MSSATPGLPLIPAGIRFHVAVFGARWHQSIDSQNESIGRLAGGCRPLLARGSESEKPAMMALPAGQYNALLLKARDYDD
jgi:hypothetical protein